MIVNNLLPDRPPAYRAFRSTETAIAGLLSDILLALDAGDIAALALLSPVYISKNVEATLSNDTSLTISHNTAFWLCLNWTTATSQLPVYHAVICTDCSLSSTLPHVSSQLARSTTFTSHQYLYRHWPRMPQRFRYMLCILVYHCEHRVICRLPF